MSTPLHFAAKNNQNEVIKVLLSHKETNVNCGDNVL